MDEGQRSEKDEGLPEEAEDWLAAFFQSNALFSLMLVSLLIIYFASERSVLHVRLIHLR